MLQKMFKILHYRKYRNKGKALFKLLRFPRIFFKEIKRFASYLRVLIHH